MMRGLTAMVLAGTVVLATALTAQGQEPARAMRVGTFEPRDVALAYLRSEKHNELLKATIAEHKKLKDAGDKEAAKAVEKRIKAFQEDGHRQVFGVGPYDSLAELMSGTLAEVAREQKVDVIVIRTFHAAPGVQTVDLTEAIIQKVGVTEKTRKVIAEMRQKIASGEYHPEEYKGEH